MSALPGPALVEPARTALLVMDVQRSIVDRHDAGAMLDRLAGAIAAARDAGVAVIFAALGFRPGQPEVSPNNRMFAAIAQAGGRFTTGDPGAEIHPALGPRPADLRVTKRRVSAFAGSDLEMLLRAKGIEHLVLTGIATSGVVLSTLRAAADMDYRLTVLRDACADADPEVHRVLLDKVFPRQADVVTVAEWAGSLAGGLA